MHSEKNTSDHIWVSRAKNSLRPVSSDRTHQNISTVIRIYISEPLHSKLVNWLEIYGLSKVSGDSVVRYRILSTYSVQSPLLTQGGMTGHQVYIPSTIYVPKLGLRTNKTHFANLIVNKISEKRSE